MAWLILALIEVAMLAVLVFGLRFVENLERENRAVEAQLRAVRFYDEALDRRMKEMQRFRHDVNGLLQAVEHASNIERAGGVPKENDAVGDSADKQGLLLDALLSLKQAECAQAGIEFSCGVTDDGRECMRERGVKEADVQAVAQNLLQNAYEASLLVTPASQRIIAFHLDKQGEKLAIEVSNRIASDDVPSFKTGKPNPEEHGVGLQVVDGIVESYGGTKCVDFDPKTRMLTIRVLL